jgi:hypothetical protein
LPCGSGILEAYYVLWEMPRNPRSGAQRPCSYIRKFQPPNAAAAFDHRERKKKRGAVRLLFWGICMSFQALDPSVKDTPERIVLRRVVRHPSEMLGANKLSQIAHCPLAALRALA